ncbi:FHA domain-containing protein [Chloroflexota bacterium]
MNTKLCEIHGPYDATLPGCPYCSGAALPAAPSLDEDDMETDLGFTGGDGVTVVSSRRSRGAVAELDDDEETVIGKHHRDGDMTEIMFEETGSQAILWVKEGDGKGRIYKIKDGSKIGRKDGDVVLDDPKVSEPHAKFVLENEEFVIWDFGSKNGTFVNDERIRAATTLKENDTIKIGDTLFVVKLML